MTQAPTQLPLLFADAADWIHADGWGPNTYIHACAQRAGVDVRWYFGDGPREGEHAIHAAGCHYRRPDRQEKT